MRVSDERLETMTHNYGPSDSETVRMARELLAARRVVEAARWILGTRDATDAIGQGCSREAGAELPGALAAYDEATK